jgi:hypothetical protein
MCSVPLDRSGDPFNGGDKLIIDDYNTNIFALDKLLDNQLIVILLCPPDRCFQRLFI